MNKFCPFCKTKLFKKFGNFWTCNKEVKYNVNGPYNHFSLCEESKNNYTAIYLKNNYIHTNYSTKITTIYKYNYVMNTWDFIRAVPLLDINYDNYSEEELDFKIDKILKFI